MVGSPTGGFQRLELLELGCLLRTGFANQETPDSADTGVEGMGAIELVNIDLLTTVLGELAFRLVLLQRLALRPAERPTALFAVYMILRLDAVQAAHANGRRDLSRTPDQGRLPEYNLIRFDGAGGHQVPAKLLAVGDLIALG